MRKRSNTRKRSERSEFLKEYELLRVFLSLLILTRTHGCELCEHFCDANRYVTTQQHWARCVLCHQVVPGKVLVLVKCSTRAGDDDGAPFFFF